MSREFRIPRARLSPYGNGKSQKHTQGEWVDVATFKGDLNGNILYYLSPPGNPCIPEGQRIPLVPITWEGRPCDCRPVAAPPDLDAWEHAGGCDYNLEPFFFKNTALPDWWVLNPLSGVEARAAENRNVRNGKIGYRVFREMIEPFLPVDRHFRLCSCDHQFIGVVSPVAFHASGCPEKEIALRSWWNQRRTGRWDMGYKTVVDEGYFEQFMTEYRASENFFGESSSLEDAIWENRKIVNPKAPYDFSDDFFDFDDTCSKIPPENIEDKY